MKTNDTQEQAIWTAISLEHSILSKMYEDAKLLKKKQEQELDDFCFNINKQETKMRELCEGKVKINTDSENRLILDLTE